MGAGNYETSEDCLFLNVQSPVNAINLPVLVWIHGGGYGAGSGQNDFTDFLNVNGNNIVVVSIQYRLGPFGFLASEEVAKRGVANAGLLDQFFALQWVQRHISRFGGNASMVTISGRVGHMVALSETPSSAALSLHRRTSRSNTLTTIDSLPSLTMHLRVTQDVTSIHLNRSLTAYCQRTRPPYRIHLQL
jgi:carboxylesterase type B